MSALHVAVAAGAAIILFLFGIEHFSKEVQSITGDRFRRFLAKGTRYPVLGLLLGALVTAVIQSSTATSVITVGLVNAGALSFRSSLGILFGANVGTTVTAQLVALKLTDFAPALILAGFITGLLPFRWRILGRSIFYFGIVFFSLNLVSSAVEPLKSDAHLIEILASAENPYTGLLLGAVFTAIVQSSSVTSGLVIVLLQQGLLPFPAALGMILGANIGTTITAIIASASMDAPARRTSMSHVLYNVGGVLLFMPFFGLFKSQLLSIDTSNGSRIALAHLIFNATTALVFLVLHRPFASVVERIVPDDSDHEEPIEAPPVEAESPEQLSEATHRWVAGLLRRLARQYTAQVMSLQTRDKKIASRANRISTVIEYALKEGDDLVNRLARRSLSQEESNEVLHLVLMLDNVRQLTDSVEDLRSIDDAFLRSHARFSLDDLLEVQHVYPVTAKLLESLSDCYEHPDKDRLAEVKQLATELEHTLEQSYRRFLQLVVRPDEDSSLARFLSVHQRLRTKVLAFAHLLKTNPPPKRGDGATDMTVSGV